MPLQLYKIASNDLTTSTSSVTFSNIPQGYKDLKLVISGRGATGGATGNIMRFNGDTGSNYRLMQIQANGSTASSNSGTDVFIYAGLTNGSTDTANTFSSTEIYIPRYSGSTQKSISVDSVTENNATTAYINPQANLWTGTAAISTILIYNANSASFAAGSTFTLYGIL